MPTLTYLVFLIDECHQLLKSVHTRSLKLDSDHTHFIHISQDYRHPRLTRLQGEGGVTCILLLGGGGGLHAQETVRRQWNPSICDSAKCPSRQGWPL